MTCIAAINATPSVAEATHTDTGHSKSKAEAESSYYDLIMMGIRMSYASVVLFLCTSIMMKQIYAVYIHSSVEGMTEWSLFADILCQIIDGGYQWHLGISICAWAEDPIFTIASSILLFQMLYYKAIGLTKFLVLAVTAAAILAVYAFDMIPEIILGGTYVLGELSYLQSRGSQIYKIYQIKNTGILTFSRYVITFGLATMKVVVTFSQTSDILVLSSTIIALTMNFIIFAMFFIYPSIVKTKGSEIEKKNILEQKEKSVPIKQVVTVMAMLFIIPIFSNLAGFLPALNLYLTSYLRDFNQEISLASVNSLIIIYRLSQACSFLLLGAVSNKFGYTKGIFFVNCL